MCMLQGVTILQVEAIPTCGFLKSPSSKPTALSIERLGARSSPSTTGDENLRGLDFPLFEVFVIFIALSQSWGNQRADLYTAL